MRKFVLLSCLFLTACHTTAQWQDQEPMETAVLRGNAEKIAECARPRLQYKGGSWFLEHSPDGAVHVSAIDSGLTIATFRFDQRGRDTLVSLRGVKSIWGYNDQDPDRTMNVVKSCAETNYGK